MKRHLFYSVAIACVLSLTSCSGDDNSSTNGNNNTNNSELIGKWIIYKANYEGSAEPVIYEINGNCGREVLEFSTNKTVVETLYIDSDCNNGTGTEWDWWNMDNSKFGIGYSNSDVSKVITISGNELTLDDWEEWGYKKHYKKVQ
ncbi:hypothetical protein D3C87_255780 [compost metagenome]